MKRGVDDSHATRVKDESAEALDALRLELFALVDARLIEEAAGTSASTQALQLVPAEEHLGAYRPVNS